MDLETVLAHKETFLTPGKTLALAMLLIAPVVVVWLLIAIYGLAGFLRRRLRTAGPVGDAAVEPPVIDRAEGWMAVILVVPGRGALAQETADNG